MIFGLRRDVIHRLASVAGELRDASPYAQATYLLIELENMGYEVRRAKPPLRIVRRTLDAAAD